MLYASTRNKTDSFTAFRTLREDRTPDGGLYVPFRLPIFTERELEELRNGSFSNNVARVLNLFFSAGLTAWDVELCAGRNPVKTVSMSHRILLAELWHNLDMAYAGVEKSLYGKLSGTDSTPSEWARIAIYIAVLFGIYPELPLKEGETFDIAVNAGDLTAPMAAWYARKMGLPLGMILCGCSENSGIWDLIHHGQFSTGSSICQSRLPEADLPLTEGLERLIYEILGMEEADHYRQICERKGTYQLLPERLGMLAEGLYGAVVGFRRIGDTVRSLYRTNGYIASPYTALSAGALQDYRAATSESRLTLVPSQHSPALFPEDITQWLGIHRSQLQDYVHGH